jgi:hypothetical protein
MESKALLKNNLAWEKHPQNDRYFYIETNDTIILLRINNFPDEPLYTSINGLDIVDMEDIPERWHLNNI